MIPKKSDRGKAPIVEEEIERPRTRSRAAVTVTRMPVEPERAGISFIKSMLHTSPPRCRYGSRRGHGGERRHQDGARPATGSHNPQVTIHATQILYRNFGSTSPVNRRGRHRPIHKYIL
ncbi:hypothetical protein ACLOJK_027188 [Asimina triloba]